MATLPRFSPIHHSLSHVAKSTLGSYLLYGASVWSIAFYVILSGIILPIIGWYYGGGGSELEKIHPATYLLIVVLPLIAIFDQRFRHTAISLWLDQPFLLFIVSCGSTAAYGILVKQVSAAPFVDTFFSTVLVATLALAMPLRALLQLRTVLDIVIMINVLLIFIEFTTQQSIVLRFYADPLLENLGGAGRWSGMLGLPLAAAQILAVYSLTTFISSPIQLSWTGVTRVLFSVLALLACLLTGGRTAVASLIGLMVLYVLFAAARQLMSGAVSRLGVTYLFVGIVMVALCVPLLDRIGLFDVLSSRLEFDNGSGAAREAVLQILDNLSLDDLWLGIDASDAMAIQQSYGLIAIEIAWANFIIICGLIFTIPLFVSFCLFLFLFLPKHCKPSVLLVSAFTLSLTFSYNSIWAKTTTLAITVAIAISNLRRDVPGGHPPKGVPGSSNVDRTAMP